MMHVSEVKHKSQIKMRELVELWPLTLCPLHEISFDEVHKACLRSQADPPVEPTPRPGCAHIHKYFSRADDEDGKNHSFPGLCILCARHQKTDYVVERPNTARGNRTRIDFRIREHWREENM